MPDDIAHMRHALRRASLGRNASPNPMVGCVITDASGDIVGVGFHPQAGAPHAEVYALREAGERAKGGTAYVTVEPCSHFGRTPPCADALINAGLTRVVVAMVDPDDRVSGRGIAKLEAAGISVAVGVCESEARRLNAAFIKHRTTGLPYIIVKTATTLDGKIATDTGDSRWITSPITRAWVHRQLRDRVDAIIVGVGTVIEDDPSLTSRHSWRELRQALRVVVDSRLRTPLAARLLTNSPDRTLIAYAKPARSNAALTARLQAIQGTGASVLECSATTDGRVDLTSLIRHLGERNDVISCLIEGGSLLVGSAMRAGIVDRYVATIAPKFVGGSSAPGPLGGLAVVSTMADAVSAQRWIMRRSGPDVVVDTFLREY